MDNSVPPSYPPPRTQRSLRHNPLSGSNNVNPGPRHTQAWRNVLLLEGEAYPSKTWPQTLSATLKSTSTFPTRLSMIEAQDARAPQKLHAGRATTRGHIKSFLCIEDCGHDKDERSPLIHIHTTVCGPCLFSACNSITLCFSLDWIVHCHSFFLFSLLIKFRSTVVLFIRSKPKAGRFFPRNDDLFQLWYESKRRLSPLFRFWHNQPIDLAPRTARLPQAYHLMCRS